MPRSTSTSTTSTGTAIRVGAAVCLAVPTAVNTILHITDPLTADTTARLVQQAAAHPAATDLDQAKFLLLLLIPGSLALAALIRREAPQLAVWGGSILCLAMLAQVGGLLDYAVLPVVAHSADPGAWVPYLDRLDGSAVGSALFGVFALGQLVGFLLLGIGLLRARVVPAWAGWAVTAFPVLNVLAHSGAPRVVGVLAWGVVTAGLWACAARVLTPAVQDRPAVRPAPAGMAVGAGR